jgi:hypothetical protein
MTVAAWHGSDMRIGTTVLHANTGIMHVRVHHKHNSRNRELVFEVENTAT